MRLMMGISGRVPLPLLLLRGRGAQVAGAAGEEAAVSLSAGRVLTGSGSDSGVGFCRNIDDDCAGSGV